MYDINLKPIYNIQKTSAVCSSTGQVVVEEKKGDGQEEVEEFGASK